MQGRKNPVNPSLFPDSQPENCTAVPEEYNAEQKVSEKTGHFVIFCFDDLNAVII